MSVLSDVFTVEEIARAAGCRVTRSTRLSKPGRPGRSRALLRGQRRDSRRDRGSTPVRAGVAVARPRRRDLRDRGADLRGQPQGLPSLGVFSGSHRVRVEHVVAHLRRSGERTGSRRPPRLVFSHNLVRAGRRRRRSAEPAASTQGRNRITMPRPQLAVDASPNKTLVKARPIEVRPPTPPPVPAPTPVVDDPLPSRRPRCAGRPTSTGQQREARFRPALRTPAKAEAQAVARAPAAELATAKGLGSGIGPGAGGGTGGGPYRAGSGVEPPRLLREVKAQYTDEARRRGTTGNVVLKSSSIATAP